MAASCTNWKGVGFAWTGICATIVGIASGSQMDADVLWRCTSSCDNVQRYCDEALKACCCGGHPLGPFGSCGCFANCNIVDPPCVEGEPVIFP